MLETLKGKKTYICAAAAVLYVLGAMLGFWAFDEKVLGCFGFAGLASFRAAIGRLHLAVENQPAQLNVTTPPPPSTNLLSLIAIGALLLGVAGCASFQKTVITTDPVTGVSVTNQVFDVTRITPLVETAAFEGTAVALTEHPEWRDGFNAALKELKFLEASEHIDFTTVLAIIQRLPVKELKSQEARLAISGGTLLLSQVRGSTTALDKLENLRPIVTALRAGVELGLSNE